MPTSRNRPPGVAPIVLGLFAATLLPSCAAAQILRPLTDVTSTHLPDLSGLNTMDVGSGDLDGDGDVDLVLAQEFRLNRILLNDGSGRFTDASGQLPTLPANALAAGPPQLRFPGAGHDTEDVSVGDFDEDGRLDLIFLSEDDIKFGRTGVHEHYRGIPGGFERMPRSGLPDTEANAVAHSDIDGDGHLDLLIAGAGQDRLLLGDGAGQFRDDTRNRLPRESGVSQDVNVWDVDGDGDLDLVLGLEGGHALWLNDGAGVFQDATRQLPSAGNVEARKVAAADVDGDGDLDLFFAHVGWQGRDGQDSLLLNDGRGRFARACADCIPRETDTTLDAAFVDIDGDGDVDLVRAGLGSVTLWVNDGAGRFTDATAQFLSAPAAGPNLAVELADFDGDGRIDLYVGQLAGPQGGAGVRDRLYLSNVSPDAA